jgi:hypothetical protein
VPNRVRTLKEEVNNLFPQVRCEAADLEAFFKNRFFQNCVNAIRRDALLIFDSLKTANQDQLQQEVGMASGLLRALAIINEQARLQASEQGRKED